MDDTKPPDHGIELNQAAIVAFNLSGSTYNARKYKTRILGQVQNRTRYRSNGELVSWIDIKSGFRFPVYV